MDLRDLGTFIKGNKEQFYNGINDGSWNISNTTDTKDFINTDRSDITSLVTSAYQTIDTLALYAREKSDSVIEMLTKVSPDEMCDFNTKNGVFMLNLMHLNEKEKEITLQALGVDAMFNGDSHVITNAAQSPSYAENMNYKDKFVKELETNKDTERTQKYIAEPNPYGSIENLYPDDDNTGTDKFDDNQKWKTNNLNSILNKTKKLFNQHKINTLISRFHTSPNTPIGSMDNRTKYGLSHGRNLLTASAEKGESGYPTNGYDNPYCRVWTHHHQYDRLDKLIRPITIKDEKGNVDVIAPNEFHKWKNFKNEKTITKYRPFTNEEVAEYRGSGYMDYEEKEWSWRDDENDSWKYSVLNENGFVNITPKFQGGGPNNIHTKQCMFSIENLAWRDYNPYSFEKALSWEQRGPMGGRIMWFPPYGLQFNETTSAQWQSNTFIGRGEDVYTYANTVRTGTLNFMMVVDHPSIIDYVSWAGRNQDGNDKVSDTDMHRFFAGCDEMAGNNGSNKEGGKLSDYAVPTPLTDEYIESRKSDNIDAEEKKPKEEEVIPDEPGIEVTFYVFFPNNYSGCDDENNSNSKTNVNAIAYLLYGKGSQCIEILENSVPLNFIEKVDSANYGSGYEMGKEKNEIGLGEDNSYFIVKYKNKKGKIISTPTKWYYRIDSETASQVVGKKKIDKKSLNLNSSSEAVKSLFTEEKDNENLYSLAEVAYILCKNEDLKKQIESNSIIDKEHINKLAPLFKGENSYKLTNISIIGYSSVDDINKQKHTERNTRLSKDRATTIKNWLIENSLLQEWKNIEPTISNKSEATDKKPNSNGDNGEDSKKYRSAKVVMTFNSEKTENLSDANQKPEVDNVDIWNFAKEIQTQLRKNYVVYSQQTAEDNKEKVLTDIINSKIDNDQYTESMKDILRNIKDVFDITVEHAPFEIDKITFEVLQSMIKIVSASDKALKTFDNQEEFKNILGKKIEEQINKLSDVKKILSQYNNDFKDYSEEDSKYSEISSAIDLNNKNIEDIKTNQIPDIEKQIDKTVKEKEDIQLDINRYEKNKLEYQKIVDSNKEGVINGITVSVKDANHEIEKLNKKIKECNNNIKEIEKKQDLLNRNISNLKEKIKELEENNIKLNEKLKSPDDNLKTKKDTVNLNTESNIQSIKKVIKDYIKKESDTDEYYINDIAEKYAKYICENTEVVIRYDNYLTDSEGNIIVDDNGKPIVDEDKKGKLEPISDITFNDNSYKEYNDLINAHTDEEDKTVVISENDFKRIITNTEFKFNGKEEDKEIFYIETDSKLFKNENSSSTNSFLTSSNSFANGLNNSFNYTPKSKKYGYSYIPFDDEWIKKMVNNLNSNNIVEDIDWNSFKTVLNDALNAHMWLYYGEIDEDGLAQAEQLMNSKINEIKEGLDKSEYVNFSKHYDKEKKEEYYINENETDPSRKGRRWFLVNGKFVLEYIDGIYNRSDQMYAYHPEDVKSGKVESNKVRYDQEYHFFRVLEEKDRITYDKLMNKIQYFNPAYHSMTPEGFSARLTFLQQCMRQGNTRTASDYNAASANNLAFGRPPYCMLRLGDFYNQMIVIDNISINYDPLMWDLNTEGVGVIPLLANVSMSFKFIGGGSMYGAVSRLQNAMTFNYYANSNLYDNRADRPRYKWDDKTNGALEHDLIKEESYFHSVENYTPLKYNS